MNLFTEGQISEACYMVNTGKPMASFAIKVVDTEEIIKLIHTRYKLKTHIIKSTDEWNELYIYKKDFMLEIIKNLPHTPNTTYDHWVLGKAYGYSDEAIEEFILIQNEVKNENNRNK